MLLDGACLSQNGDTPFLVDMNFSIISCVQARCASSKIATRSGGTVLLPTKESRYLWMIWMNADVLRSASALETRLPHCCSCSTLSRARASCSTVTNGKLPDRNIACSPCYASECRMAIFKPTNVLPAPGTPVTKQMDFRPFDLLCSIMRLISSVVIVRFSAPASLRVMSCTLCPRYNACAASTIVGVGRYSEFSHFDCCRSGGYHDWYQQFIMTFLLKVTQIQCIVIHLIVCRLVVFRIATLEF